MWRRDLLDGASRRCGQSVQRVGDVLRDALERGAQTCAQTEQLLDLLLQLADLPQAFGAQCGRTLLGLADDEQGAARRIALELIAALTNLVQRSGQFCLALAERLDAAVKLCDLGLHRIRPGAGRLELVLQLLMRERRAGDGELDVALPVAAKPGAAEFCLVSHELRVDLETWTRQGGNWFGSEF
jgi:hypothetical protein